MSLKDSSLWRILAILSFWHLVLRRTEPPRRFCFVILAKMWLVSYVFSWCVCGAGGWLSISTADWRFSSSSLEITWLSMSLQLKGIMHIGSDVSGASWSSATPMETPSPIVCRGAGRSSPSHEPPCSAPTPPPPPPAALSFDEPRPGLMSSRNTFQLRLQCPVSFSNSAPHTITVVLW